MSYIANVWKVQCVKPLILHQLAPGCPDTNRAMLDKLSNSHAECLPDWCRMCTGSGLHSATSTANKSALGTPTLASVAAAAAAAKTEEADWRQRIISVRRHC